MEKKYDVYSIGNPLMDILTQVEDTFLEELNLNKGIMHLIETDRRSLLLEKIPTPKVAPGGSCANTAMHLSDFGLDVVYSGAIGNDEIGDEFESGMVQAGTVTEAPRKELPTGTSIILITPDAERTQNTYLGACQQYSQEDINDKRIQQSKYLYFTGYMWDTENQKEALNKAIEVAEQSDTKIIFDVADPFAVGRSKANFIDIISNHADFVLANREEAKMMSGSGDIPEAIEYFRTMVDLGVIKDGANGSFLFDQDNVHHVKAFDVNAIDTTGAGDIYASGILYGLARDFDLQRTGRIASFVASKVVEQIGARLDFSLAGKIDTI